ncbi:hypothetical protein ACHAXT_004515 [Thalassiosira profunda]
MDMKWRRIIPYAALLSRRVSTARPSPANLATTVPSKHGASDATATVNMECRKNVDDDGAGVEGREPIGGGAINEKPRLYQQPNGGDGPRDIAGSWNPRDNLSHMLHALVGLDRYPNYLSRFKDVSDIGLLEHALEARLNDVRRQRDEIVERRDGIRKLVRRYIANKTDDCDDAMEDDSGSELWRDHATLSPPRTWSELRSRRILREEAFRVAHQSIAKAGKGCKKRAKSEKQNVDLPSVEDVISGSATVNLDPALLEGWMSQELFDVYSFPLLTEEFCSLIRTTLREISALAETNEFSHLKLGRRVIDLDTVGLGWISDLLLHLFIRPISTHLFAATEKLVGSETDTGDGSDEANPILDWRQGYVAGYSADPTERTLATRHRLVPHTDDAELTLNCCLGEESYVGGAVEFYGLRGTPEEGQLVGRVERPNVGTALLHSGRHLHAVSEVTSGDRYALIIWTRGWKSLRSNTCPCCWLNRRQDTSCICDKRWN